MFDNINDCWDYLREAKSIDDLNERIEEMPKWSGSWLVEFVQTQEQGQYSYDEYLIINCVDDMNEDKENIWFSNIIE
jgi:hypothetical protein